MFSGIIEEVGQIIAITPFEQCQRFKISAGIALDGLHLGDSIAVNGVCLTVTTFTTPAFTVEAVPETLALTNLSQLSVGSYVNLERAITATQRIGGHMVQGHVDGMLTLNSLTDVGGEKRLRFKLNQALASYIIHKGFITIDGISLTVSDLDQDSVEVTIIPHTWQHTCLQYLQVGKAVNVEVDMVAKYVERILHTKNPQGELSCRV